MQALVFQGTVVQKEATPFPVHDTLKWAPIPSGTTVNIGDSATESNGTWTFTPAPAIVLTLAQKALEKLGDGLNVTSASTPSLNGKYSITGEMQANLVALEGYYNKFNSFPNKQSTVKIRDMKGTTHTFTYAQFEELFQALGDYHAALEGCIDGTLTTLPLESDFGSIS